MKCARKDDNRAVHQGDTAIGAWANFDQDANRQAGRGMRSIILTLRAAASFTGLALLPTSVPAFAQSAGGLVPEISFDLNALYDDNFGRASETVAQQRGVQNEEFTLSPTVSLNLARQIGVAEIQVVGSVGYVFHANNSELDRERIDVSGRADMPVGPCRITPELGLQRRQSDLRDVVFLPDPGASTAKNTETTQSYGIQIGCGRNPGVQPFVGISYERGDNSASSRERAEYESTTYRAGLSYASAALGEISIFGSRRETKQSPLAASAGGNSDYRVDEVGVSFKRPIGSRLTATASMGYSKLGSDNILVDRFEGLVWNVELVALIGANLRISAGTGRNVNSSLASDAGFVVTTPHRVRLEYALSDRASFEVRGSITRRRFGYAVDPGPFAITDETQRAISGRFSYSLGRRVSVSLNAGHERRSANGTFFDYRASFAGASIGLRF